jgi:hypothetical protein
MGKIDLNPFDDPGGPLEIDLYASNGFDDIDIFDIDLNPFDANEALEIDINGTLEDVNQAILEDPFGTLGMVALALTPGAQPWAYAMMSGASAAQQGGDPGEIVQAMGLSYFGSTVGDAVTNQATQFLDDTALDLILSESVNETFGATISEALGSSAGQFSRTLIHTGGNFESAANAFATGAFNQGMAEVLGGIDELLPEGKGWASLNDGVKKAITSGITTVAQGGDVTVGTLSGLVQGYSESVIPTVNNYIGSTLSDGSQLSDASIALITEGLARSLNAAVEGGDTTDAFFSRFRENADTKIREYINSAEGLNVNRRLDDLFNNTRATTTALAGLNEEYGRLLSAQTAYNTLAAEGDDLRTKANNGEIPESQFLEWFSQNEQTLADLKAEYNGYLANIPDLSQAYTDATGNMLSDMDEFTDEFTPITEIANEVAATTLNPLQFDEAKYREQNNIGPDENIYQHYLNNKLQADTNAFMANMENVGAAINDLSSDTFDINLPSELAPIEYQKILPTLNVAPEADTKPTIVEDLQALDAIVFTADSSNITAQEIIDKFKTNNTTQFVSVADQIEFLSQSVTLDDGTETTIGQQINNRIDDIHEDLQFSAGQSLGDKMNLVIEKTLGTGLVSDFFKKTLAPAFGEIIAGVPEGVAQYIDEFVQAYQHDSNPENNPFLQAISEKTGRPISDFTAKTVGLDINELAAEALGDAPFTGATDFVNPFVTYSQGIAEELTANLSSRARKALADSQYTGDVIFKDFYGFPVPVGFENMSLGKNPSILGYTLHASEGIIDIVSSTTLYGLFGKKGLVAGGYLDAAEATGMAALEAEKQVYQALQNPDYIAGDEYQDFLKDANGDTAIANAKLLAQAKQFVIEAGLIDGALSVVQTTMIVNPLSAAGNAAISLGVTATSATATDALSEAGEQVLINAGLTSVDIPNVELGSNVGAALIGGLTEGSPGSGMTVINGLTEALRTGRFNTEDGKIVGYTGPILGASMIASSISPDIAAAGSDPEAIIQNAIKADLYRDVATFVEAYPNIITEAPLSTDKTFLDINNPESGYVYSEEDLELAASVDGNFVIFEQGVLPTLTGDVAYIMEDMGLTVRDIKNVGAKALEQIEANNPELYSQLLPSQKVSLQTIKDAEATNNFLQEAGLDAETAVSVTDNVTGFDAVTITPAEVTYELNTQLPGIEFSDDVVQGAIDSISGVGVDSDIATLVASYTDPYYFDTSEIIAAAQAEGITLTEEQAEAYTTVIDDDTSEDDVIDTIVEDDAQVTEDEVQTIIDNAIAGLPETASPQDVEDAIETAISGLENLSSADVEAAIEAAVGELENLSETDVQTIVDNAVENLATTTDVETAIQNAIDGLPETASPQDVEDAIGDALEGLENLSSADVETAIETAVGDLENLSSNDVQTIVDNAVENLATTTDVETAIQNAIDGLPEFATPTDVETAITDALGDLENLSSDDVQTAVENAIGGLENLSETDVQTIVDNAVENLATTTDVETAIQDAIDGLPEFATPTDVETAITDALGDLENLSSADVEAAIETAVGDLENLSSNDVQTIVDNAVENLATTTDVETAINNAIAELPETATPDDVQNAIDEAIGGLEDVSLEEVQTAVETAIGDLENLSSEDVQTIVDNTVGTLETQIGEVSEDVEALGTDVGTLQTDLTNLISNVGDVDAALIQLSTDLGTSEEAILGALDTTKEELETQFLEEIAGVVGDVEALGTDVDTLQTDLTNLISDIGDVDAALIQLSTDLGTSEEAILSALDTTKEELETSLGEQLTDVQTELGADIDAIAELIGKPAQEVTQTDVDFVVDLLAQESINEELTTQYDVTGDGVVTQDDVTLLDQILAGEDVTPADTSVFAPTGLFAQQAQDTQTTQDLVTQLATDIQTQINTQTEQQEIRDLLEMEQQGLLRGARARTLEVDPINIEYLYDIGGESIFATPQQESLFTSPYGRRMLPPTTNIASGLKQGGQVEDETDMLLNIIGD